MPGRQAAEPEVKILELLGPSTPEKRWLAASLAKTIRLQMNPTPEMRAACAMTGPDWISE